ncbi:uncharacterized protein LOC117243818 isoform X1 [Parus major]|uniref:uncharacterized protein LOC117243818 isoform X1 n=1 Tax=Parus major TaxID=9157 RepID=UPI0014445DD1|nr:uncharacterized protein LOC117243818 isoform X1 [Parus major]
MKFKESFNAFFPLWGDQIVLSSTRFWDGKGNSCRMTEAENYETETPWHRPSSPGSPTRYFRLVGRPRSDCTPSVSSHLGEPGSGAPGQRWQLRHSRARPSPHGTCRGCGRPERAEKRRFHPKNVRGEGPGEPAAPGRGAQGAGGGGRVGLALILGLICAFLGFTPRVWGVPDPRAVLGFGVTEPPVFGLV